MMMMLLLLLEYRDREECGVATRATLSPPPRWDTNSRLFSKQRRIQEERWGEFREGLYKRRKKDAKPNQIKRQRGPSNRPVIVIVTVTVTVTATADVPVTETHNTYRYSATSLRSSKSSVSEVRINATVASGKTKSLRMV